ncbi:ArsR/SmtB family transcription factor [Catellatospora bangladeshensis]|uniref:ArsR/SmtB family transcription factor n=1 Tax=Catellatospora bangladeshensis TaxID=310355 RepID=UPI0036225D36
MAPRRGRAVLGADAGARRRQRVGGRPGRGRGARRAVRRVPARLLDILRQPATTSELARRTGMAAGTVSEHLGVMHAAGLLARSRHGRTVLYVATAAGQSLLDARDRPGPG